MCLGLGAVRLGLFLIKREKRVKRVKREKKKRLGTAIYVEKSRGKKKEKEKDLSAPGQGRSVEP